MGLVLRASGCGGWGLGMSEGPRGLSSGFGVWGLGLLGFKA